MIGKSRRICSHVIRNKTMQRRLEDSAEPVQLHGAGALPKATSFVNAPSMRCGGYFSLDPRQNHITPVGSNQIIGFRAK